MKMNKTLVALFLLCVVNNKLRNELKDIKRKIEDLTLKEEW